MTTLGQVKINGQYDTVSSVDPTTAEKAPDYEAGHRWLNLDTGESFVLSDAAAGTWTQIETSLDARINAVLPGTFKRVIDECIPRLCVTRQVALETAPDSITKTAFWYLQAYVSIFAEWTVSGASIESDDITGDLEDFEYEDAVYIYGSRRNDGVHTIESVDAEGLTFSDALIDPGSHALVLLVLIPVDLKFLIGRMVWFDVQLRAERFGLASERIGTYSYNVATETVGGMAYPADVVAGIGSYLDDSPIADSEWTP